MRLTRAQARQRNHDALVAAAVTEMADKGYAAARLEDIAERAELTTGAIYSIFGSKQDLLVAAVGRLADDVGAELTSVVGNELTLVDALGAIASAYHRAAAGPAARQRLAFELELLSLVLRDPAAGREVLGAALWRTENLLAGLLTGRRTTTGAETTAAQARQLAPAVASLLGGLVQRATVEPGSVTEDYCVRAAVALASLVT
ncbi:hypothetical protein BBK82_05575 [Lentzea guizhouensis]|uniref:HTH tetR-type domain-containing protein n=1 Tax=Lentzea guizhouensis TaxID=1586287 RepID=A0A1B2HD14_9PSEU|nr:TetR/AcrR family transcriptional regulator [Lentzea guizhouensis]ANZ35627.1 hypothetical protein BBK82_05575 [Lentzea guizhouensis]